MRPLGSWFTSGPLLAGLLLACCGRGDGASSAPSASAAAAEPAPSRAVLPLPRTPQRPSAPDGFVEVTVGGVAPIGDSSAVLLVDLERQRAVPIFIGETEALTIQLRLERRSYARPLTHDLLDSMMKSLGGEVESVRVDKLDRDVFYGKVVLHDGDRRTELDARSSDAVAVALGHAVPIFMAKGVLVRAGIALSNGVLPETVSPHDAKVGASAHRNPVSL